MDSSTNIAGFESENSDIPFWGDLYLGITFIPIFIVFIIGIYSGGIIDGVDGLSGGVFASIYSAYAIIAFANGQIDLAAYASVVVGGLLAFLWFNIPPARFFNSETGTMALTMSLVVVAFLPVSFESCTVCKQDLEPNHHLLI